MSKVQLRRVDEAQNMRRFYSLALQPDLWGGWWLVREHGRIGSPGRVIVYVFESLDEATAIHKKTLVGQGPARLPVLSKTQDLAHAFLRHYFDR